MVTNTRTPGTRCYGLVTMGSTTDASKCIDHLHRTELHGRIISVERTKSDICVTKPTKADGEKKADTSSDRKKPEKEVKKDDSTKDSTVKSDGEKPADAKKREVTAERKRENAHPQRQRITARISRERNEASSAAPRRPVHRQRPATGEPRDVLSFQKIRDERERQLTNQRLRERERKLREEERRRVEARRRQREEEERLLRERERLKKERLRLEREKADLLRLERERQKLEREKIELERLELKRQQLKYDLIFENFTISRLLYFVSTVSTPFNVTKMNAAFISFILVSLEFHYYKPVGCSMCVSLINETKKNFNSKITFFVQTTS